MTSSPERPAIRLGCKDDAGTFKGCDLALCALRLATKLTVSSFKPPNRRFGRTGLSSH